MLGNATYDGLDEKLDRLTEAGITLHCQVVLCPGWNDGKNLERTVSDLAARYPGVQSVAIVPVGLTGHREGLPFIEPVTPVYARRTIRRVEAIQRGFLDRWDSPFVYLGDEFYIMAGKPIPPPEHYREFPQIENGVGMVRTFLDDFEAGFDEWRRPASRVRGTVATGQLFHPFLAQSVERLGLDLTTVAVGSRFWGAGINVAGLLTGGDFVAALEGRALGDFVLIPSESMIGDEGLFLDDMTRAEVESRLGVPVIRAGYTASDFLEVVGAL
jgi:putative radical SAM enzyme (TIGR03279 family)